MYNTGQEYLIRIGSEYKKCTLTHILGDEGCCSMILVDGFKLGVLTLDLLGSEYTQHEDCCLFIMEEGD